MEVPAIYIDPKTQLYAAITVRTHTQFKALGDVKGTSFGFAERVDIVPELIFLREQGVQPLRGGVISISHEEAYRVDTVEPPDGITVKAKCPMIPLKDLGSYPTPDEAYAFAGATFPALSAAVEATAGVTATLSAVFTGAT
jgi:hypothetical protein